MAPGQGEVLFSDVEDDEVDEQLPPMCSSAEQPSPHTEPSEQPDEAYLSLIWLAFVLLSGVVVFGAILLLTAELTEADEAVDRVLTFLGRHVDISLLCS
jgi:hypothetical protein